MQEVMHTQHTHALQPLRLCLCFCCGTYLLSLSLAGGIVSLRWAGVFDQPTNQTNKQTKRKGKERKEKEKREQRSRPVNNNQGSPPQLRQPAKSERARLFLLFSSSSFCAVVVVLFFFFLCLSFCVCVCFFVCVQEENRSEENSSVLSQHFC